MKKYFRQHRWQIYRFWYCCSPNEKAHPSANSSWICSRGAGKAKLSCNRFCLTFLSISFAKRLQQLIRGKKLWPKFTKRIGFSLEWWPWRLPVRWALEIRVLLPGESVCWLPALEIRVLLPAGESVWWSPSPTSAAIRGSLIMTSWFLPIH